MKIEPGGDHLASGASAPASTCEGARGSGAEQDDERKWGKGALALLNLIARNNKRHIAVTQVLSPPVLCGPWPRPSCIFIDIFSAQTFLEMCCWAFWVMLCARIPPNNTAVTRSPSSCAWQEELERMLMDMYQRLGVALRLRAHSAADDSLRHAYQQARAELAAAEAALAEKIAAYAHFKASVVNAAGEPVAGSLAPVAVPAPPLETAGIAALAALKRDIKMECRSAAHDAGCDAALQGSSHLKIRECSSRAQLTRQINALVLRTGALAA